MPCIQLPRRDGSTWTILADELTGADFRNREIPGLILAGRDCSGAMFTFADLSGGNLSGATLSRCDFRKAVLAGADFSGAKLNRANLRQAQLQGADLTDADLQDACLVDAKLDGAQLAGANLYHANLGAVDLSKALGLAEARLSGAIFNEYTRFPAGFDPETSGAVHERNATATLNAQAAGRSARA